MTEMTEEMKESRCDVMLRNNLDALFFIFKTQFFSGYMQTVAATKLLYFTQKNATCVNLYHKWLIIFYSTTQN